MYVSDAMYLMPIIYLFIILKQDITEMFGHSFYDSISAQIMKTTFFYINLLVKYVTLYWI